MDEKGLSIVIPAYNARESIKNCIESIYASLELVNIKYEIFIIDDLCPMNTGEWVTKNMSDSANLRVVQLSSNTGAAFARNVGIYLSKYDLIAFCDSDDTWKPNKLKLQFNSFDDDSVLICSHYETIRKGIVGHQGLDGYSVRNYGNVELYSKGGPILMSSVIVRRKAVIEIGCFNPLYKNAHDTELWLRLLKDNYWNIEKSVCVEKYWNIESLTNVKWIKFRNQVLISTLFWILSDIKLKYFLRKLFVITRSLLYKMIK